MNIISVHSERYNFLRRRIWKDVRGVKTFYHYSDSGLVAEMDSNGNTLKSYGYRPDSLWGTDPLFMRENGKNYWYLNDHLGTPQIIVAENGGVVWKAQYQVFGKAEVDGSSTLTNNLRFPGQYYDEETGLYYNWNRYYDPESGRYSQTDPIGFEGGINLYEYTQNNSVNLIDPTGKVAIVVPLANPAVLGVLWKAWVFTTTMIGAIVAIESISDSIKENECDENPCSSYPHRSVAFSQASIYAGYSPSWNKINWNDYNYPPDKESQIQYTKLRQRIGNDPYGYSSPEGGEIVEHPSDIHHPCPHFHAKKFRSDSPKRFPYDPEKL